MREVFELGVHAVVEVADEEVAPKLVEDVEVVRTGACGGVVALVESFHAKLEVGF